MDEQLQIVRIESYLSGKLSTEEQLLFEADLSSNQEFHHLFLQHKYFLDGINGMKLQTFSEKLANTPRAPTTGTSRKFLVYSLVAIAVLALISIVYFSRKQSTEHRLAKEYYIAPLAELQRTEGAANNEHYQAGMLAFDRKDWTAAIAEYHQIEAQHPLYEQVQYFKAHALIGDRRYSEAQSLFREITSRRGQYVQQAEWNLALTELFMNSSYNSIEDNLMHIEIQSNHFYREKATQLLERIRKVKSSD